MQPAVCGDQNSFEAAAIESIVDTLLAKVGDQDGSPDRSPGSSVILADTEPLVIPGRIIHLYRSPMGYDAAEMHAEAFVDIRLSETLLEDHFVSSYISAIEQLLDQWSSFK